MPVEGNPRCPAGESRLTWFAKRGSLRIGLSGATATTYFVN
jgi:hypothetical protein